MTRGEVEEAPFYGMVGCIEMECPCLQILLVISG